MKNVKAARPQVWLVRGSALVFLLFLVRVATFGLTVEARSFDQLVSGAETIFVGRVISQQCVWKGIEPERHIVTQVTLSIQQTLKGAPGATQTLEFLGGVVGDEHFDVPGMPQFIDGETYLLFVAGNGRQLCPLVGAWQGQLRLRLDRDGKTWRVYSNSGRPLRSVADLAAGAPRPLASGAQAGEAAAMSLEEMAHRIGEKLQAPQTGAGAQVGGSGHE